MTLLVLSLNLLKWKPTMAVDFNIMSLVQRNMMTPQEQAQSLFLRPTRNPEVTPVADPTFTPIAVVPKPYKASTYGVPQEPKLQQDLLYERPPLQEYKPVSFLEKAANAIIPSAEATELPNDSWDNALVEKQLYDRGNTIIPALSIQPLVQSLENKNKIGFNPDTKTWSPHESPERGNDTIAYGHKLLDKERDGKFVILEGEKVPFTELTENKAQQLFKQDWSSAKNQAKAWFGKDWNKIDNVAKELATELVFNIGPSVTKGKTEFSKFKRKAIAGQDYLSEINRTYDGGKPLTNRTNSLKDWANSLR